MLDYEIINDVEDWVPNFGDRVKLIRKPDQHNLDTYIEFDKIMYRSKGIGIITTRIIQSHRLGFTWVGVTWDRYLAVCIVPIDCIELYKENP